MTMPLTETPALWLPSYASGYASSQAEAANPGLWDGLMFNWHGPLGPTGLTARDGVRKNDGTLTNMDPATGWVVTKKGYALDFDVASTQYVNLPTISPPLISAAAWVWNRAEDDAFPCILYLGNDGGSRGLILTYFRNADTFRFYVYDSGVGFVFAETATVSLQTWYHVCGTYDGATVRIYLDGKVASTTAAASLIDYGANDAHFIGRYGASFFHGLITNVAIHNRALTPNEIQQLIGDTHAITRPMQWLLIGEGAAPPAFAGSNLILGGGVL